VLDKEWVPADLVLVASSSGGTAYIDTMELDGEV